MHLVRTIFLLSMVLLCGPVFAGTAPKGSSMTYYGLIQSQNIKRKDNLITFHVPKVLFYKNHAHKEGRRLGLLELAQYVKSHAMALLSVSEEKGSLYPVKAQIHAVGKSSVTLDLDQAHHHALINTNLPLTFTLVPKEAAPQDNYFVWDKGAKVQHLGHGYLHVLLKGPYVQGVQLQGTKEDAKLKTFEVSLAGLSKTFDAHGAFAVDKLAGTLLLIRNGGQGGGSSGEDGTCKGIFHKALPQKAGQKPGQKPAHGDGQPQEQELVLVDIAYVSKEGRLFLKHLPIAGEKPKPQHLYGPWDHMILFVDYAARASHRY